MRLRWLRNLFDGVRHELGIRSIQWEYGTSDVGGECRRHRITGRIEFILWPAGHPRGYPDRPYWCEMEQFVGGDAEFRGGEMIIATLAGGHARRSARLDHQGREGRVLPV